MIDAGIRRTPASLGIAGFDAFRPTQIAALERIAASTARVVLVQAPTGSGKSLIARAAGAALGMHATYCSTTKQLQAQFCRDFQDAIELRGRANYPTSHGPFPAVTCEDCDWREGRGCSWCESAADLPLPGPEAEGDRGALRGAQHSLLPGRGQHRWRVQRRGAPARHRRGRRARSAAPGDGLRPALGAAPPATAAAEHAADRPARGRGLDGVGRAGRHGGPAGGEAARARGGRPARGRR